MLGGYISDLEKGDVFKPVEYVITPFMVSEYAHGVEENSPYFHSAEESGRPAGPPTDDDPRRQDAHPGSQLRQGAAH